MSETYTQVKNKGEADKCPQCGELVYVTRREDGTAYGSCKKCSIRFDVLLKQQSVFQDG